MRHSIIIALITALALAGFALARPVMQSSEQRGSACSGAIFGCLECNPQMTSCNRCAAGMKQTSTRCYCPAGTCGKLDAKGRARCADAGQGFWSLGGSKTAANNAEAKGECVACGSGLTTQPSGKGGKFKATSRTQCKVSPGKYYIAATQSVAECAKGTYRAGYAAPRSATSRSCNKCVKGVTTKGTGATSKAECIELKPGFFAIRTAANADAPVPTEIGNTTELGYDADYIIETQMCPKDSYYEGGDPVPGCKACGNGITTYYEGATGPNDCYLQPGMGSKLVGGVLTAFVCPQDTHAMHPEGEFGIAPVDCVACPANTNTEGKMGQRSVYDCSGHTAGYGFADGATTDGGSMQPCPINTFNPATTEVWVPCKGCGFGRYTELDPAKQTAETDCLPVAGHGLQLKEGVFEFSFEQLLAEANNKKLNVANLLASLPMAECPEGMYSAVPSWAGSSMAGVSGAEAAKVQALAQVCQKCAAGMTTAGTSASSASECTACLPGFGHNGGTGCSACPIGTYSEGYDVKCWQCDEQAFNVHTSELGLVPATTLSEGSTSDDQCVPTVFGVAPFVGDGMLHPGVESDFTNFTGVVSLEQCTSKCAPGTVCIAGMERHTGRCKVAGYPVAKDLSGSSQWLATVHIKLPASDKEREFGLGSSRYISCYSAHTWDNAAAHKLPDMPVAQVTGDTSSAVSKCRAVCTDADDCVAFVYQQAAGVCSFKKASVDESWLGWEAAVVMAY